MQTYTPVDDLTAIAWRLAEPFTSQLWLEYLALGGTRVATDLHTYLQGGKAWPNAEHNVLAHALNEELWAFGLVGLAPHR